MTKTRTPKPRAATVAARPAAAPHAAKGGGKPEAKPAAPQVAKPRIVEPAAPAPQAATTAAVVPPQPETVAKAVEELGRELAAYAQTSMALGFDAGRALLAARTLKDWTDAQAGFFKASLDHFLIDGARLSELSLQVASRMARPPAAAVPPPLAKALT